MPGFYFYILLNLKLSLHCEEPQQLRLRQRKCPWSEVIRCVYSTEVSMPHKEQSQRQSQRQSQSQSQVEQSVAQLQLKLLIILLVLLALLLLLLLAGAAYYVNVWLHIAYPCKRASKSSRQLPRHVRLRLINAKCCLRARRAQHYKMPHQRSPAHRIQDTGLVIACQPQMAVGTALLRA